MNKAPVSSKQLTTYVAWLFALSWGLQLLAIFTTKGFEDAMMPWWLAATMLSPSIVTFLFLRNDLLRVKFLWRPSRNVIPLTLLSVIVPILFAFFVLMAFEYFGGGDSTWFEFSTVEVTISGGPFLLGKGTQSWTIFILNIVSTGLVFALLNSILAAGEEIAWRGLLQGILIERFGIFKGILLLGFIWSMWHLPIQLYGYNYPENPTLGSLIISPIILIGYSFFMAWITLHSKSFIPAAVAHGAINGIQEGIISQIDLSVPELNMYLIRLLAAVVLGLIFMFLLMLRNSDS